MSIEVTLTWQEVALASHVGTRRRLAALMRQRPQPYGWDPERDTWGGDVESAAAELAVAKVFDRYWEPLADDLASLRGDVGALQVRSTWRPHGCLLLHGPDADDATFVLACGRVPHFTVVGSIRAGDGKRPEWWRTDTGRPAFFVPQSALAAIDRLAVAA